MSPAAATAVRPCRSAASTASETMRHGREQQPPIMTIMSVRRARRGAVSERSLDQTSAERPPARWPHPRHRNGEATPRFVRRSTTAKRRPMASPGRFQVNSIRHRPDAPQWPRCGGRAGAAGELRGVGRRQERAHSPEARQRSPHENMASARANGLERLLVLLTGELSLVSTDILSPHRPIGLPQHPRRKQPITIWREVWSDC